LWQLLCRPERVARVPALNRSAPELRTACSGLQLRNRCALRSSPTVALKTPSKKLVPLGETCPLGEKPMSLKEKLVPLADTRHFRLKRQCGLATENALPTRQAGKPEELINLTCRTYLDPTHPPSANTPADALNPSKPARFEPPVSPLSVATLRFKMVDSSVCPRSTWV
jgi:hypothetical protein